MDEAEIQNFLNVHLLIVGSAANVLRKVFQKIWSVHTNKVWGNTPEDGTNLIFEIGHDFFCQQKRIQWDHLQSGDLNKWGLFLLIRIVQELGSRQQIKSIKINKSQFQSLDTLIAIRNKICTARTASICNGEYKSQWSIIFNVLKPFGVTEKELNAILSKEENMSTWTISEDEEISEKVKQMKEDANELLKNGDVKGAIEIYSDILLLSDISPEELAAIYSDRSKAYLELENADTANAIQDCEQVINLRPRWFQGYLRGAIAYETCENFKQAIKMYNMARLLNMKDEELHKFLVNCQFRYVVMDIGSRSLYRSAHDCKETFLTAKGAVTKEKIEQAMSILRSEDSYMGLIIKGHVHRAAGKFKEATGFFEKALNLRPHDNSEALYNLAMLLIMKKLDNSAMDEGIELLKKAASQKWKEGNAGISESQFIIGLYQIEALGDCKGAVLWFRRSGLNFNGLPAHFLAILHYEGIGVDINKDYAVELWNVAAKSRQKVVPAMEFLIQHYLKAYDFKLTLYWYKEAIKNGSKFLSTSKYDFATYVRDLENDHIAIQKMKTSQDSKKLRAEMQSKINKILGDDFKENWGKITSLSKVDEFSNEFCNSPASHLQNEEKILELKKAARKGNEAAKIILETHTHYTNAFKIIKSGHRLDDSSFNKMIQEMASAIRLDRFHILIPDDIGSLIWKHLKPRIPVEECDPSDLDRDIRICYSYILTLFDTTKKNTIPVYSKGCVRRYPQEFYFHFMVGQMYVSKGDFRTGLKEVKASLKVIPNHPDLLYMVANMSLEAMQPEETIIDNYLEFLKYARSGDNTIPAAYYWIATSYAKICQMNTIKRGRFDETSYKNVQKYRELGMLYESKQKLAPCFFPFNHLAKDSSDEELGTMLAMRKNSSKGRGSSRR